MPIQADVEAAVMGLTTLGADLDDLPFETEAHLVEAETKHHAPIRSGHLASTVQVTAHPGGFDLVVSADYTRPVLGGVPAKHIKANPFIHEALDTVMPHLVDQVSTDVAEAITRNGFSS